MQDATSIDVKRQARQIDPLWKMLWVGRILSGVWLIAIIASFFYSTTNGGVQANVFTWLIFLLFGIVPILNQATRERNWLKIAQHRTLARTDPMAPGISILNRPGSGVPELVVPVHIELRPNKTVTSMTLIPLIAICLVGLGIVILVTGINILTNIQTIFIVAGSIIGIVLLVLLPYRFISGRYLTQTIDITEEGITTRYLDQQRSIHWNEVSVFGRYQTQGWGTATTGLTYELSNAQTIVRWSQNTYTEIVAKSSQPEYNNYNWLLGQIITLAMTRTSQPLLNLEEKKTAKRPARASAETGIDAIQEIPPFSLGQEDPIISKIVPGHNSNILRYFGIMGAGSIILELLVQYQSSSSMTLPSMFLIRFGVLSLSITLLILLTSPRTDRFWLAIQHRRELAVQTPNLMLAANQPVPSQDPPQPDKLCILTYESRQKQLRNTFLILFIILMIIVEIFFFSLNPLYQLAILGGTLLLSILLTLLTVFNKNKTALRRIDVSANGLATHYITADVQINWEDVRLFATYKNISLFNRKSSPERIYELVGEQAVVRWPDSDSPHKVIATEPSMSREEYERWITQLHGYITEKTHLPLHDLDRDV